MESAANSCVNKTHMTTAAAETSLCHTCHDTEHSTRKNCDDDAATDADQYSNAEAPMNINDEGVTMQYGTTTTLTSIRTSS